MSRLTLEQIQELEVEGKYVCPYVRNPRLVYGKAFGDCALRPKGLNRTCLKPRLFDSDDGFKECYVYQRWVAKAGRE